MFGFFLYPGIWARKKLCYTGFTLQASPTSEADTGIDHSLLHHMHAATVLLTKEMLEPCPVLPTVWQNSKRTCKRLWDWAVTARDQATGILVKFNTVRHRPQHKATCSRPWCPWCLFSKGKRVTELFCYQNMAQPLQNTLSIYHLTTFKDFFSFSPLSPAVLHWQSKNSQ